MRYPIDGYKGYTIDEELNVYRGEDKQEPQRSNGGVYLKNVYGLSKIKTPYSIACQNIPNFIENELAKVGRTLVKNDGEFIWLDSGKRVSLRKLPDFIEREMIIQKGMDDPDFKKIKGASRYYLKKDGSVYDVVNKSFLKLHDRNHYHIYLDNGKSSTTTVEKIIIDTYGWKGFVESKGFEVVKETEDEIFFFEEVLGEVIKSHKDVRSFNKTLNFMTKGNSDPYFIPKYVYLQMGRPELEVIERFNTKEEIADYLGESVECVENMIKHRIMVKGRLLMKI